MRTTQSARLGLLLALSGSICATLPASAGRMPNQETTIPLVRRGQANTDIVTVNAGAGPAQITVDAVDNNGVPSPQESMSLGPNQLWGDYVQIPGGTFEGDALVHVEADAASDVPVFSPGQGPGGYTFYGRYTPGAGGGADSREPLGTTWAARYLNGGNFGPGSVLQVWRDAPGPGAEFEACPHDRNGTIVSPGCQAHRIPARRAGDAERAAIESSVVRVPMATIYAGSPGDGGYVAIFPRGGAAINAAIVLENTRSGDLAVFPAQRFPGLSRAVAAPDEVIFPYVNGAASREVTLTVLNAGSASAGLSIDFVELTGAVTTVPVGARLPAFRMTELSMGVLGMPADFAGAIRLRADNGFLVAMLFEERGASAKKRVANGVPPFRAADAASKRAVVAGGAVPDKRSRGDNTTPALSKLAKKTKVFFGALNLGKKNAKVKVIIRRADGSTVFRRTFTIAPGATLLEEFPKRAKGSGHWIEYTVKGKGASLLTYEVEDNSFDPLFIPGQTLR